MAKAKKKDNVEVISKKQVREMPSYDITEDLIKELAKKGAKIQVLDLDYQLEDYVNDLTKNNIATFRDIFQAFFDYDDDWDDFVDEYDCDGTGLTRKLNEWYDDIRYVFAAEDDKTISFAIMMEDDIDTVAQVANGLSQAITELPKQAFDNLMGKLALTSVEPTKGSKTIGLDEVLKESYKILEDKDEHMCEEQAANTLDPITSPMFSSL